MLTFTLGRTYQRPLVKKAKIFQNGTLSIPFHEYFEYLYNCKIHSNLYVVLALDDAKVKWDELVDSYDAMMNATEDATLAVSNAFDYLSAMGCGSNDPECQSAQALLVLILKHKHSFAVS